MDKGKTQPKLHVKPQYGRTPLKVDYGSGQGYNDCILYFASEQSARNFMGIADANKPIKVKSLQLKKIGEDKNGYVEFKIIREEVSLRRKKKKRNLILFIKNLDQSSILLHFYLLNQS